MTNSASAPIEHLRALCVSVGFIDAYNAAWMLKHEICQVYTFDRRHFARIGGMTILVPGEEEG